MLGRLLPLLREVLGRLLPLLREVLGRLLRVVLGRVLRCVLGAGRLVEGRVLGRVLGCVRRVLLFLVLGTGLLRLLLGRCVLGAGRVLRVDSRGGANSLVPRLGDVRSS